MDLYLSIYLFLFIYLNQSCLVVRQTKTLIYKSAGGFLTANKKEREKAVLSVHCCRAESVYKQSSQHMKYAPRCIPHTLGLSTFLHEHRHEADENLGLDTAFL